MKTYYRLQYSNGQLSMIVQDDKEAFYECARLLSSNKIKYPVCVWVIKPKQ